MQNKVNKATASYALFLNQLSEADREQTKQYVDLLEQYSFEKEQRAYARGLIECIDLLIKIGLIRENKFLEQIIKSMQKKMTTSHDNVPPGTFLHTWRMIENNLSP